MGDAGFPGAWGPSITSEKPEASLWAASALLGSQKPPIIDLNHLGGVQTSKTPTPAFLMKLTLYERSGLTWSDPVVRG